MPTHASLSNFSWEVCEGSEAEVSQSPEGGLSQVPKNVQMLPKRAGTVYKILITK